MDIFAKITGVKYTPLLCSKLKSFSYKDFDATLSDKATFILQIDPTKQIALRTCLKKKNPTQKLMFMLNHWSSKILT